MKKPTPEQIKRHERLLARQQANLERFKASGMTVAAWRKAEKKRHKALGKKTDRIKSKAKAFEMEYVSP